MDKLFKKIRVNNLKFIEHVENHYAQAAQDVLLNTVPLIQEMKQNKLSWEKLHKYLLKEQPGYIVDKDNFMIKVRSALNDESYWIETLEFYESKLRSEGK